MDMDTTNVSLSKEERLQDAFEGMLLEYLPLIIWMSLLSVVGIIGNVLTIIFYVYHAKKSSTIILIIFLASFDLVVCCLIFTTIADLCVNVYFSNVIACKFMYFADHWIVVSSVLILWLISIDRYRKLCKPFKRQFTTRSATWCVVILTSSSFIISFRDFFTYTPITLNFTTSHGVPVEVHYCTNSDEDSLHLTIIIFLVFDVIMIFSVLITFVYTYGKIWLVLRKHNKKTEHIHKSPSGAQIGGSRISQLREMSTSDDSILDSGVDVASDKKVTAKNNTDKDVNLSTSLPMIKTHFLQVPNANMQIANNSNRDSTVSAIMKPSASMASFASVESSGSKSKKVSRTVRKERNVTIMMLAVSVGFCICFTPYFFVTAGIRLMNVTTEAELTGPIQFALRSPFWNSVINPIIFCVFNSQYRNYVKGIFTKCKLYRHTESYSVGSGS